MALCSLKRRALASLQSKLEGGGLYFLSHKMIPWRGLFTIPAELMVWDSL